jgi:hypothetical protein
MTEIPINQSKTKIAIKVTSQSLHALGFEITVYDSDRKTVIEQFTGDTKTNETFIKTLGINPSICKDKYVRGTFTVISPNGDDFSFSILFAIIEDDEVIKPEIPITGTTKNGKYTSIETFHLN